MFHTIRALLLLLTTLPLLSCSKPGSTRTTAVPPAQALHEAVEQWFEEDLRLNPLRATYIGDHRYDDVFGNPSTEDYEKATRASWEKARDAVQAVPPSALSREDQLTREIFLYNAAVALEGLRFPQRLLPLNQMDSPLMDFAKFGSGEGPQPLDTPAQHVAWLRRARGFPLWVESAIEAMREGQARGITYPRVTMENVLGQVEALHTVALEESLFWKPFARLKAEDRSALEPQYRAVFGEAVMPSLAKLRDFLRDEHLKNCRTTVGWTALPEGAAWYDWSRKYSTTLELPADEIHELGLEEVARINAETDAVRRKVAFKGDLPAFLTWVRSDPRFYFERAEQLLDGFRALKTRIDARLPELFSVFPRAGYEVRPVEAFRAESAPGAMYQAPSADGTRPGIFYVNTFNLKAQPRYGMQTLSLHEAAPGHHFQTALQQELELPRFRRFGGYNAFSEGWALYVETLGPALGLYEDPMDYYGHLADEQLRAMRLVVDTGLHAKGWSREQAIRFMLENSSMAESDVIAEVERYMVWPGQALGYKLGQLRILALRDQARSRLKESFDLKQFHAAVLTDGPLPFELLERKIARLIEETNGRSR